ncbi:MAG: O-antigen ligase family protein [Acidobacteria bacterium]|nr:O-antigen ligase family protein [Acidobacteriota bacterium]
MALLALAAWPYLTTGPLWLTLPSLLLPFILGFRSPVLGIGLLLGSAPFLDGVVALALHGSPEMVGQAGLSSWVEPVALGLMAGMTGRLLWRREPGFPTPPGFVFFLGAMGLSLLLALARFWPAWQGHLPAFLHMAWRALPDASPLASEHTLRAGLLLMAGAAWFALLRRSLRGPEQVRLVAGCWLAGSFATGVYGTLAWAGGWDRHWPFSSSLLEDKNSYGSYLVLTLFMAWAMLVSSRNRWARRLAGAALLMTVWMLLLSGSKIALIVAVTGTAIIGSGWLRRGHLLLRAGTVLGGLLLAILLFWGSLFIGSGRIAVTLSEITSPQFLAGSVQEHRLPVWSAAGRAFLENPVLGLGPGLLYRHLGSYYPPGRNGWRPAQENAHNQFLQLAAETGGMGLAAFLILVGGTLLPAFRRGRGATAHSRILGLGILCFLATALSGHPLLLSRQVFLFWGALGCLAAWAGIPDGDGRTGQRHPAGAGLLWLLPLALPAAFFLQPFQRPCATTNISHQVLQYDFPAGFYPREESDQHRWRWMKSWGELRLCNHGEMVKDAHLVLEMASLAGPRMLHLFRPGREPVALDIAAEAGTYTLPPMDIPPGGTSIILQASPGAEVPESHERRALSVAIFGTPRLLGTDPQDSTWTGATP